MSNTRTLTKSGTSITRFNALRHGLLSKYTVLPWEDTEEYATLLAAFVEEHAPQGPTEEHLVEELAGILWRKRRLRLAEAAAQRRSLERTFAPYQETVKIALVHLDVEGEFDRVIDAIQATDAETKNDLADMDIDEEMTRRAFELLSSKRHNAYERALAALREDTRQWWAATLARDSHELKEDEEPVTPDAEGLHRFLESEVFPWFTNRRKALDNRPLIREQAFGEALDAEKLEGLIRYEVHLDRKLERMLAMLFRLRDLRQGTIAG
jgi:hypothetical protein